MRNSLIEKVYPKKSIERIKSKTKLLGVHNKIDPIKFMNLRIIGCLTIFFLILLISKLAFIWAPIITIAFYYLSEYLVLDYKIKNRISKLDYEALFFFEVLTLSLETGRDLKGALRETTKNLDSEISDEFKETLRQVEFGKTLTEALGDMKERIPSDNINNVILNIRECNVFGSSIIDTLYRQVDFLREKKVLEVRSIISKMPIKISIISVLFFIPILLLLILSPVILNLI